MNPANTPGPGGYRDAQMLHPARTERETPRMR